MSTPIVACLAVVAVIALIAVLFLWRRSRRDPRG